MIDKGKVKKILVITLSNIGDVVLAFPVVSILREYFPEAELSVMVGPRAKGVFEDDPRLTEVIVYEKHLRLRDKVKFARKLRAERFNLVADLRNTLFPLVLGARYKTSLLVKAPRHITHMRDRHLWKLKSLGIPLRGYGTSGIWISPQDEDYVSRFLEEEGVAKNDRLVAMSPGARSNTKRWSAENFMRLADMLIEQCAVKVIMVGDKDDSDLITPLLSKMKNRPLSALAKTNLKQLVFLLKQCALLITNDSAPLHISVSVGTPVLAIFGPTDAERYGPRGKRDVVVKCDLSCVPCRKADCRRNRECLELIKPDEVFAAAKKILGYEEYE